MVAWTRVGLLGVVVLVTSCQFPELEPLVDAASDAAIDAEVDAVPDTTAPETMITASPAALANSLVASFTFTANEPATFSCQVDSEAAAPCTSPYTRSLTAGAHTFQVTATDTAGNADPTPAAHAWTIDVVPPVTSFTAAPAAIDNSTTVSFEFNASEPATFECALDGTTFAACTSPAMRTGLIDGAHTFRVRATDAAGNVEPSPATHTWSIDSSTPDTQIDSGPTGVSNVQSPTFTFSSADAGAGATFECALDAAAFAACTSPRTYTNLNEGSHTFRVRVRDVSNNVDPSPATRTWSIDLTGPETTIDAGPSGAVASTSAAFSFSSNEAGVTFECNLDGGGFAACPSTHNLAGLPQGSRTLQVRAVDLGGNRDSSPASRTWTVDTVAPVVTITAPAAAATTGGLVTVTFSVNEPATVTCRLDGAAAQACASPLSLTLASGSHSIEVLATDPATNVGMLTRTWTVDATLPDTTITSGPSGAVASTSAAFTVTSDDGAATFECSLDGAAFATCPASPMFSGLTQGMHTLQVRAVDGVGNRDPSPASRTWTVDTVAPNTAIASAPAALTTSTAAMFDFTSEAGATFACNLDGAGFVACTDPVTFTVGNGAHTLQVRAVDAAGNVDASPAAHSWTVDNVPPDTTIVSGPAAVTATAAATFDLASEAGATFQCNRDNAGYVACGDPFSVAVGEGLHTLLVRAVDAAGNVDPTPASYMWTLDITLPDTTITAGPSGPFNSASATFTFTSNEGTATFECSLDGGAFAVCASPRTFPSLTEGAHTFRVRAVDAAGNRDSSPATADWTVDTNAPVVAIQGPPPSTTGPRVTVLFTVDDAAAATTCRFDTGAFTACTSGTAYNLAAGMHTLEVRATDAAGNVGSRTTTWTVACSPPSNDTSTILQLRLEEADGVDALQNVVDGTAPGFKGTVTGADLGDPPSTASGRFGRALHFPRVAAIPAKHAQWIRPQSSMINALTIELWMRPQASQDGWAFVNNSAVDLDDNIGIFHSTFLDAVYVYAYEKTNNVGMQTPSIPITRDQWHHVVVTYASRVLTLWVDGVAVSNTSTVDLAWQLKATKLGWQGGSFADAYEGQLDEVMIYDRALTAAEVLDRYCPAQ